MKSSPVRNGKNAMYSLGLELGRNSQEMAGISLDQCAGPDHPGRPSSTAGELKTHPASYRLRPAIAYLGSKAAQADWISSYIVSVVGVNSRIADVFSGTGAVSAALKANGLSVIANDYLLWASHVARAILFNDAAPPFRELNIPSGWLDMDGYDSVLRHLNNLPPVGGFLPREYSPSGPAGRRYLTTENAGRATTIRKQISAWSGQLTEAELSLLVADLIVSVSSVSNTAGTYSSYLKHWKKSALSPLLLQRSPIIPSTPSTSHEVHCDDANQLVRNLDVDAVYADPPYTKRQYAAYYHLFETVAAGDEPEISGTTGLRPWEHLASAYCYRRHASSALEDLVSNSPGQHFFLSYSDDGQIRHSENEEILGAAGSVVVTEYFTRRYRSNDRQNSSGQVRERFYHMDRDDNRGDFTCRWLG